MAKAKRAVKKASTASRKKGAAGGKSAAGGKKRHGAKRDGARRGSGKRDGAKKRDTREMPVIEVRRIHRRDLNRVWDFIKLSFAKVKDRKSVV